MSQWSGHAHRPQSFCRRNDWLINKLLKVVFGNNDILSDDTLAVGRQLICIRWPPVDGNVQRGQVAQLQKIDLLIRGKLALFPLF